MQRHGPGGPTPWRSCARPTSASPACPASRSRRTTSSGDGAARALRRRGPARGAGRAPAARRAVVVVPVSQDDPDPRRGGACAPSRPISSASAAPTSRRAATTTRISATSTGWRGFVEAIGAARHHARVSGLGRPASGCASSPSIRARFARVVAANTFLPTGDRRRARPSSPGASSRRRPSASTWAGS